MSSAPPSNVPSAPRVVLGIAGGSGSGKSWLAKALEAEFGGRCAVVCHDWWYKDNARMLQDEDARRELNFDHPDSLETSLMCRQLDELRAGLGIDAPVYDYATHSRLRETRRVEPKPLLIVDGILILQDQALRQRLTLSVFIDVPDDVRLLRRVRRDVNDRRIGLEETLRVYEHCVRPMHHRFVAPSSRHATWIWSQLADTSFPKLLIEDLKRRLDAAPAAA